MKPTTMLVGAWVAGLGLAGGWGPGLTSVAVGGQPIVHAGLQAVAGLSQTGTTKDAAKPGPRAKAPSTLFTPLPKPEPAPAARPATPPGNLNLSEQFAQDAPSQARSFLNKGRLALQKGDVTEALSWYQKSLTTGAAFAPNEYTPAHLADELRRAGVKPALLAPPTRRPDEPAPISPFDIDTSKDPLSKLPFEPKPLAAGPASELKPLLPPDRESRPLPKLPPLEFGPPAGPNAVAPAVLPPGANLPLNRPAPSLSPLTPAPSGAPALTPINAAPKLDSPFTVPSTPFGNTPGNTSGNSPRLSAPPNALPLNALPLSPTGPRPNAGAALSPGAPPGQPAPHFQPQPNAQPLAPPNAFPGALTGAPPRPMPNAGPPSLPMPTFAPPGTAPNAPPSLTQAIDMAKRLIAQGRFELDRGNLQAAEHFARQAEGLRVPNEAFDARDMRPWQLLLEIDSAKKRRGGVVAANYNEPMPGGRPGYPVRPGVYQPNFDPTRTIPAQAESPVAGEPTPAPLPIDPTQPPINAPPGSTPAAGAPNAAPPSEGLTAFRAGMDALAKHDSETALRHFTKAWQFRNELPPQVRQQVQDKLTELRTLPPPVVVPSPNANPIEAVANEQLVLREKLTREINRAKSESKKRLATDPEGTVAELRRLRERVRDSQLDAAAKKQLLTLVDQSVVEAEKYVSEHRHQIDVDKRNAQVRNDIELDRKKLFDTQEKTAQLVEKFNKLVDERRYPEAEVIAKQVRELDPDSPIAEMLSWKITFAHRIAEQEGIKANKEESFYRQMSEVESSAVSHDERQLLNFGDKQTWDALTRNRRRWMDEQGQRLSPAGREIRKNLKNKVDVRFDKRPLQEVIDTLSALSGVPIVLDPQGLAAEAVSTDQPVTLRLGQQISLESALNLILRPLRLSYVIGDEVLKVSSEQARESDVYIKVYNVADLVIPIPNFVAGSNQGMAAAMEAAHRMAGGYGGNIPLSALPYLANNESGAAVNPLVLAQQVQGAAAPGGKPAKSLAQGPGGVASATTPDFDTLIELITRTVLPASWDEVGGPGSIEASPANLSLVISNTQEVHEQIQDLLEQLRRLQDLQVTIEIRFITLNDNFFERIGVDFDFEIDSKATGTSTPPNNLPNGIVGLNTSTGGVRPDLDIAFNQDSFGAAVPQFGGFDAMTAASIGFAILSDIELYFLLQAAQGDQRSNVLQAPKVTLFNGQTASVSDTTQRPFVTSIIPVVADFAAAHMPVVTVLNEGTSLNVQAVVSPDRRFVRLTLVPFFSRIGDVQEFTYNGKTVTRSLAENDENDDGPEEDEKEVLREGTTVQLPNFAFTSVSTTVSVPDGGTILLGGIKRLSEGRSERGVPILGKLPYINRLFKNVGIGRTAQSLMMTVTPRIIIQEEEEQKLGLQVQP